MNELAKINQQIQVELAGISKGADLWDFSVENVSLRSGDNTIKFVITANTRLPDLTEFSKTVFIEGLQRWLQELNEIDKCTSKNGSKQNV